MSELEIVAEPGVPQILTAREVAAPRDLVFRAFMEPELLEQWLGGGRYTMTIERWEPRDGGSYRFIHGDDDGNAWAFRGVFHGDPTPDQTVQTFEFEGAPGHVQLDTLTLEEHDGTTTIRTNSVFQSVAARDAMVDSGMTTGMTEGYARLDELVARELKARHDTT
jgi:uncharacterized protein YndB with AHSA1/START domain